jgi:hypothetical protein
MNTRRNEKGIPPSKKLCRVRTTFFLAKEMEKGME